MSPAAPAEPGAFVPGGRIRIEGASDGPLAGLTFAVKDLFDVAGTVTGAGNPDWARTHAPAERSAPVVEGLLGAGATLLGKAHTDELSRGITGVNAHYGTPGNPGAPDRVPGGSSSGSAAAVAGGLADFALGTDTGGSVRIPAAFCGLFGLRPTHGRLPLEGVLGQAPEFDTIGWLTRDGPHLARVGAVLLGIDPADRPFDLLLARDAWALADATTRARCAPTLERLARLAGRSGETELAPEGLGRWRDHQVALQQRQAWLSFGDWITAQEPRLAWGVARNFLAGAEQDPARYREAEGVRGRVRDRLDAVLRDGLLCIPTAPGPAPRRGDRGAIRGLWSRVSPLTCVAGLCGLPQLTIPVADGAGAPVGVSLVAGAGEDERLLALAARW